MIASLPMYDRPETAGANDRLWARIRDGLRAAGNDAPDALTRADDDLWSHWTAPDLTFSQTCGFPYRSRLHGQVTLIGTPDYAVAGCPPGFYRSVFVAREDDPRRDLTDFDGAAFAYNEALSQSGWAAPQNHVARLGLRLPPALQTGAHRLSALAVAEGRADLASLDAVTWRMLCRWDPVVATLREVAWTDPTPGLPYIAGPDADGPAFRMIVGAAINALDAADRDATGLVGLVYLPPAEYLAVPSPPRPESLIEGHLPPFSANDSASCAKGIASAMGSRPD